MRNLLIPLVLVVTALCVAFVAVQHKHVLTCYDAAGHVTLGNDFKECHT